MPRVWASKTWSILDVSWKSSIEMLDKHVRRKCSMNLGRKAGGAACEGLLQLSIQHCTANLRLPWLCLPVDGHSKLSRGAVRQRPVNGQTSAVNGSFESQLNDTLDTRKRHDRSNKDL